MSSESRPASMSVSSPASSSSPSGKRTRDPEDEVYLDNVRSQKRYLSEIMACSLNGLTVGDSLPVNMLESPARSETFLSHRDELSPLQYSPMSEDSDEARSCEDTTTTSQLESRPTSPVSPYRYQKPFTPPPTTTTTTTTTTTSTQSRRPSDTEGRFPSSPSDICHSGDLRRTALLRSVQMRTQPCGYNGSSSSSSGISNNIVVDGEERMICCNKSMEEEDRGEEEIISYSNHQVSSKSKSCKVLDMRLCENDE